MVDLPEWVGFHPFILHAKSRSDEWRVHNRYYALFLSKSGPLH